MNKCTAVTAGILAGVVGLGALAGCVQRGPGHGAFRPSPETLRIISQAQSVEQAEIAAMEAREAANEAEKAAHEARMKSDAVQPAEPRDLKYDERMDER